MTVETSATAALGSDAHELTAHERRTAALVWILVFGSCLAWTGRPYYVIVLPPRVEQMGTAIAVVVAFWLALKLNPRLRLRGSWPVWLYALVPVVALMPALSGSAGGLGTVARAGRFLFALLALALIAPVWRSDPWVIVNAHTRALRLCVGAALISLAIGLGQNGEGRLISQVPALQPPQVGQFAALLAGMCVIQILSRSPRLPRCSLWFALAVAALLLSKTRTPLIAGAVALGLAILLLAVSHSRARELVVTIILLGPAIYLVMEPAVHAFLTRGQGDELLSTLTGRTLAWARVHTFPRTGFQELFGIGYGDKSIDGLPIDNGYLATYHEAGKIGLVIVCTAMAIILLRAFAYPKAANRAMSIFLLAFVAVASYTETGIGDMSAYVMHVLLAAIVLTPLTLVQSGDHFQRVKPGARS
jgi:hypothetical protein